MITSRAFPQLSGWLWLASVLLGSLWMVGCSGQQDEAQPDDAAPAGPIAAAEPALPVAEADEPLPPPVYESALPEAVRAALDKPFKGDLDEMVKRRLVRIGVT